MSDQANAQALIFRRIADDVESHPSKDPFSLGKAILEAVGRILQETGLAVDLEQIVAAAKQAYDQYVTPIDLPLVPNFVEPAIDALIWKAIEMGIRAIAARTAG